MSNIKHSSTEQALDLLGQEHRVWLTNMDEIQDRGCYDTGSEEEAHILVLADASYRVAAVFDSAYDALHSKAVARGHAQ